ncbi:unnamed protein product [Dovyalis caffra]|uniref:GST N-terminal domain-containing protein n=1 Tax=Dovyalis caffra TaxID=77055 RepID=A0AAV1QXT8_9ROSI|nr:unnamed protein product [Dovyalis caffra]
MATGSGKEVLPPALTSNSDPPPVFDGTSRLYISYTCPYAQRVWITRNCKGLQDKIKLVPIDLRDRPAWYKEKVYPTNKVKLGDDPNYWYCLLPGLFIQNSYADCEPQDPAKKEFAEELFSYTGSFSKAINSTLKGEADEAGAAFDYIETALSKFEDGPFFLGQFSLADISYAPFIERFRPTLLEFKKYDITAGRPKLAAWMEEMNKMEAYNQTRRDPKQHVETYRKRYAVRLISETLAFHVHHKTKLLSPDFRVIAPGFLNHVADRISYEKTTPSVSIFLF